MPRPVQRMMTALQNPVLLAFAVKGANALFSFLVTLLLARLSGAEVVGAFALALSTMIFVGILGTFGLDQVAVRAIAGDLREGRSGLARGVWRWSLRRVTLLSALVAGLFGLMVLVLPVDRWLAADRSLLLLVAAGAFGFTLFRFVLAVVRAVGWPVHAQVMEGTASALVALGLFGLLTSGMPAGALPVFVGYVGAQLLATLVALARLARLQRGWAPAEAPETAPMVKAGYPIMATSVLHQFSDWFLVAAIATLAGAAETGAFRVAAQIMTIAAMMVTTADAFIGPRMAGDLRLGRGDMAWRRHRRITLLMLLLAGPVLLSALVVPEPMLRLLFGAEFTSAAAALAIMAVGQWSNVLKGPTGSLLVMAGHERILLWLAIGAAVLLVVLTVVLTPRLGLEGAAIAYAASLLLRNGLSYLIAWRKVPRRRTDLAV